MNPGTTHRSDDAFYIQLEPAKQIQHPHGVALPSDDLELFGDTTQCAVRELPCCSMNLGIIEMQTGCGRRPRGRNHSRPSDAKDRYSLGQSASELCASPTTLKVCRRVQHDQY